MEHYELIRRKVLAYDNLKRAVIKVGKGKNRSLTIPNLSANAFRSRRISADINMREISCTNSPLVTSDENQGNGSAGESQLMMS